MAITDPQAIRFSNEVVRPMCERVRAMHADLTSARAAYDGGIGQFFAGHGADQVEDGRHATEGVSQLVGNDVLAFVDLFLYQLKAFLEEPGVPEVIAKPCVRDLITG